MTTFAPLSLLLLLVGIWLAFRTLKGHRVTSVLAASLLVGWLTLGIGYAVADHFTGNGIDESVLFHLRVGLDGAGLGEYLPLMAFTGGTLLACLTGGWLLWHKLTTGNSSGSRLQPWAPMALLVAIATHPAAVDINRLVQRQTQTLHSQPRASEHFAKVTTINLPRKKNLVVLYLESVERTYLDRALFPGLMPRLSTLEKQALSFTDVRQVFGTGWTIAGMVASQCGLPLVTPGHGNSMAGTDQFLPEAHCLGDVLKHAGYNLNYMGGADLDFAGKGTFYRTHGFQSISGLHELKHQLRDPSFTSSWGLYDDDLYNLAQARFDDLAQQSQPFGLFMLTLDTHPPKGHRSKQCGTALYGNGDNAMLNAVHCADQLASNFIEHVVNGPHAKDTVLLVVSDHLAMRNSAWSLLEKGHRRNLALVFDADHPGGLIDKPGATIDLAPTILQLLGGDATHFGYGRSLMAQSPTLVEAHGAEADSHLMADSAFLASLWNPPQLFDGLSLDIDAQTVRLGSRQVRYPALFLVNEDHRVTTARYPFYSHKTLAEDVAQLGPEERFVWVDRCQLMRPLANHSLIDTHHICVGAGSLDSESFFIQSTSESTYVSWQSLRTAITPGATNDTSRYIRRQEALDRWSRFGTDQVHTHPMPAGVNLSLTVKSSAYDAGPSLVRWRDAAPLTLARGLTVLGVRSDSGPTKLGHIDTCDPRPGFRVLDEPELESGIAAAIKRHQQHFDALLVVAHDSVRCEPFDLQPLFEGTLLSQWIDIGFRQPYMGIISGDTRHEYLGTPGSSLVVELTPTP